MFKDQDIAQLKQRGTDPDVAEQQIQNFKEGFPNLEIVKAATINDGILQVSDDLSANYVQQYETLAPTKRVVKFVPASGAASRMFKHLFQFQESYTGSDADYEALVSNPDQRDVFTFFKRINDFAFYEDLTATHQKQGMGLNEAILQRKYKEVLNSLLNEDAMNYGSLPKGLLKFHRYGTNSRTPVEEHLVEGANYARDQNNNVYLHFTVSPEHRKAFEQHIAAVKGHFEKHFGVRYYVTFSEQKPATDTIAVDMNNEPFREDNGEILFRPGGHGALIENLNDLDADIVFIKNIDNVVPDRLKEATFRNKKLLGGILLQYQQKIFEYLRFLDESEEISDEKLEEMREFVEDQLCVLPEQVFSTMDGAQKIVFLEEMLDRPIRVCGMVKNEGEPGGGPFWAVNPDGSTSLQIVESAQIDMDNPDQRATWENATHFNPVDIACSLKNHRGEKFDLTRYVNPKAGFISKKSKGGQVLKAQELPGLWNGSMSDWTTIFVEVPIVTFNPVKTVNDLLREQHQ
uniref:DUF4301 family protein n=1 Tax=Roseihalotalea indica TaxID=2867963 RepID=A0AA49JER7_9BACT|nr:DUF4301 family protein [Tunicatimonas sp. TK19036]